MRVKFTSSSKVREIPYLIISYLAMMKSPTPATTRSPVDESSPGFLFPGALKACI
jgi:hypothetical protein